DMPGGAAHVGLERPEVRAPAQPFGALDRVGLDQQREVEARPMELVAALAQERRVAERWDEDGLKGRRFQDARISCDASAPAGAVLDQAPFVAARPEKGRMAVDLRGEKQVA